MESVVSGYQPSCYLYEYGDIRLFGKRQDVLRLPQLDGWDTLLIATSDGGKVHWGSGEARLLKRGTGLYIPGKAESSDDELELEGASGYLLRFRQLRRSGIFSDKAGDEAKEARVQDPEITGIEPQSGTCSNALLRFSEKLELLSFRPFSRCLLLLETLFKLKGSTEPLACLECDICFQELMWQLLQYRAAEPSEAGHASAVERTIGYIEKRYAEILSVGELAEVAGMERGRYTRQFKAETGRLPLEYVNEVRIGRAQQMLLLTGDRLSEIALCSGFNNEYYFNRRFKGATGVSPGRYRRLYRSGTRMFAPFLEDYLLALGQFPVMQTVHPRWGKQDYLKLEGVPEYDVTSPDLARLASLEPELILLNDGYRRWGLDECRQVAPLFNLPYFHEDWRATLRSLAAVIDVEELVDDIVADYERKAANAKRRLSRHIGSQTAAFLRISGNKASLYGYERGFTAGVLHRDLGLSPDPLVVRLTAGKRMAELSEVSIADLKADHLFIAYDRDAGEPDVLTGSAPWRRLPAVAAGRVYEVDFMAWMNYGILSHHRKVEDVIEVLL
ncbi:AraC family transcriptional regulator [Paenibacillus herberti]|uniref:AraC family transcriptional regulator n=1 Tax=Paenibacillus herberti TaxID=1619309 RepID=A0A229NUA5_9BACL|nr:AraC family transcriptional regulator [Paenibacillus herberti]OXM13450.1 AraC family transcriptional regulator [Paenibacillus herberti]